MCSPQNPHEHEVVVPAADAPRDQEDELVLLAAPRGRAARLGVGLVRVYQRYISAYTPPMCRFYPTCSQYTLIAIQRYGLLKGSWLGAWRIMRCHPFHPGGIDHVP